MMPRPLLTSAFALTYRKIPVLAIGRDIYCDTSLISETLDHHPALPVPSTQNPSIHPPDADTDRPTRTLSRLLASHYTDRPWFRIMTGLVPGVVWRTHFGTDRAGLIGHRLDADKLEKKIPSNLVSLERDLSILEPRFEGLDRGEEGKGARWMLNTASPSMVDISLYFMLTWGRDIARGVGVEDLTGGASTDLELEGMERIFNVERYPGVWRWFCDVKEYFDGLDDVEVRRVEKGDEQGQVEVMKKLREWKAADGEDNVEMPMLPTPRAWNEQLDARSGIRVGAWVSIAPDDTGRDDPVLGKVVKVSAEEVVIEPAPSEGDGSGVGNQLKVERVRHHFPRTGFVIRPVGGDGEKRQSKL